MGVFGAFFGRRGDAGFSGSVLGVNSGVVGFNVAMFLRAVREVFSANRARAGLGCSAALPAPVAVGVLHYMKPSGGASAACRSLMSCNSPPLGGGEAATHSGVVPKVQTTSTNTGENGGLWARWSTFWAHRCLARCMCSHANP